MSTTRSAFADSPNRKAAVTIGSLSVFFGLLGFFWVEGVPFAGPGTGDNAIFALFRTNPLMNGLFLVLGALLIVTGTATARAARQANATIGAVFLLLAAFGFVVAGAAGGNSAWNFIAASLGSAVLYAVFALVLIGTSIGADRHLGTAATA